MSDTPENVWVYDTDDAHIGVISYYCIITSIYVNTYYLDTWNPTQTGKQKVYKQLQNVMKLFIDSEYSTICIYNVLALVL